MTGEKDKLLKQLLSSIIKNADAKFDLNMGKDLISNLAAWAGKGKDEIVQLICREIGVATAAVLKEPISKMLENKKLEISLELVPKNKANSKKDSKT